MFHCLTQGPLLEGSMMYRCLYLLILYTADMFTFSSALLVVAAAPVEVPLAGVWGVTFASRCSLLLVQLRVQSWHEAHAELQHGRKRQMLTRHTNQPGDQQHQQSTKAPATTARRM